MDDKLLSFTINCALNLVQDLTLLKQDHSLCGHSHLRTLLCMFQLWTLIDSFGDSYLAIHQM